MTDDNRAKMERVKLLLKEEFGIETEEQLDEEIRKMEPLNIGVFVSPIKKPEEKQSHHNAIFNVNGFRLLAFLKAVAHTT